MKLRAINKDRRYQLTDEHIEYIHKAYHEHNMTMSDIAGILWISRQRIGQILDLKGTRKDIVSKQVLHNKLRYHTDDGYKAKFLQSKKDSYKYKVNTLSMC